MSKQPEHSHYLVNAYFAADRLATHHALMAAHWQTGMYARHPYMPWVQEHLAEYQAACYERESLISEYAREMGWSK